MNRASLALLLFSMLAHAEETPASAPAEPTLRYDKGFTLESGDCRFELKILVRSQFRFTVEKPDDSDDLDAAFSIPRLRLQLEGIFFGSANTYKVEFDFANSGDALLKDFWFDHAFDPMFHVRGGQWKKPFNRQQITSDFALEFIERSIADSFSGAGRDIGATIQDNYEKSPELEWALGVFNGTGTNPTQSLNCTDPADATTCTPTTPTNVPGNFDPVIVGRIGWNYNDIKGYSEGDLEGGPLRLALAASYQLYLNDLDGDETGDFQHSFEADMMLKLEGFDLSGAFYLVKKSGTDLEPAFYVQAGYLFVPKTLELAGRFSQIPEDDDEHEQEAMLAIDWYFDGHNLQWLSNGGVLHTTGVDTNEWIFQTQFQAQF